jgi:hypothetical protein
MNTYDCDACGKATPVERTVHRPGSWAVPEGRFCYPCLGSPEEVDYYDVTVYAASGGLRSELGTARVVAQNVLEAEHLGVEMLWDSRLTCAGDHAECTVELVVDDPA